MSLTLGAHRIPGRSRSDAISSPGPSLQLDVPLVGQRLSDECWYVSACMLAYYQEAGPRLGLPAVWAANNGIDPAEFARLAAVEGLAPVPLPSGVHKAGASDIFRWLVLYGPLWAAGYWYDVGHVIVITGVAGDKVLFNDPDDQVGGDDGRRASETVAWFNEKLAWDVDACLMYKPAR
jgi:hypothetical protein